MFGRRASPLDPSAPSVTAVRPVVAKGVDSYPPPMARYPTREAVSAGGLVFEDRPDGRWVVLISRRSAAGALQWTLPKGGLEEGETREVAAQREVREETGLECTIDEPLGTIDYWFVWRPDKVRYHKHVHYFLMRHLGGEPLPRDDEAEDVVWLPIEQALERLTHANERELVARARVEPPEHAGTRPGAQGA
jgi:8-oxo-dGTP pyrophosphatase MutT (NUDIX family)